MYKGQGMIKHCITNIWEHWPLRAVSVLKINRKCLHTTYKGLNLMQNFMS